MNSKGFFAMLLFMVGVIGYCVLAFFSFLYDSSSLTRTLDSKDLLLILSSIFSIYVVMPNLFSVDHKECPSIMRHVFLIFSILALSFVLFQQQLEINNLKSVSSITSTASHAVTPNTTSASSEDDDSDVLYVGNQKTHIFHYADCPSAIRISDKNIIDFDNREDAVNSGYVPCKKCKP